MILFYKINALLFILLLSSCASTGVVPLSQDSFMIGKKDGTPGLGVSLSNQADVYREANAFCSSKGMQVETLNLIVTPAAPARLGSTELHFKCTPSKQNVEVVLNVENKPKAFGLNPNQIRQQSERDAVAIIIGISDYKNLPKADFANEDAKSFYQYAMRGLGIKKENIKLLIDSDADQTEIYRAFKAWLPAHANATTDVYVYYSGHGLPSIDGQTLYLLPQRADRDLIEETAISQTKINAALQSAKAKSVTIFLDSCYSGVGRTGQSLVANARPISLKSRDIGYPPEFTVISASSPDQISSSSPELQHGIFSFYLMKGMEGDADINKDGEITAGEMQQYVSDKVQRQAMSMNRKQEPQLVGDANRVLVGR